MISPSDRRRPSELHLLPVQCLGSYFPFLLCYYSRTMLDSSLESTEQLSRIQRTFAAFAPSIGMVGLAVALLFRITHEVDSGQVKRLLILFPIVAVATVFLTRWWKENIRFFVIRCVIVLGIGICLLLFA